MLNWFKGDWLATSFISYSCVISTFRNIDKLFNQINHLKQLSHSHTLPLIGCILSYDHRKFEEEKPQLSDSFNFDKNIIQRSAINRLCTAYATQNTFFQRQSFVVFTCFQIELYCKYFLSHSTLSKQKWSLIILSRVNCTQFTLHYLFCGNKHFNNIVCTANNKYVCDTWNVTQNSSIAQYHILHLFLSITLYICLYISDTHSIQISLWRIHFDCTNNAQWMPIN